VTIVDSHVHLWDPARFRYAWLDGLPTLKRDFLPEHFAKQTAGNARKIVVVESGCDPAQSLAEADWITSLEKGEPRLKGIVAHASLENGARVLVDLEKLASRPLVKGIRRNLQGEQNKDFCVRSEFVEGVNLLANFGYTFDVCVRHEQLKSVAELARRVPQVTFVLDHLGKPDVRGRKFDPWAADLKALAALPNVVCKLSGLTTEANWKTWQASDLEFYFKRALDYFGFTRILFGSDWPVMTLATDWRRWLETVQELVSFASSSDQTKLFQTNAERVYRV
jgi:L-fuconolactonase